MCAEGFTAIERESMFSDHIESMLDKIGEELEVIRPVHLAEDDADSDDAAVVRQHG